MNQNDKVIIELSKKELLDKSIKLQYDNVDWDYIFIKSQEQNIAALIAEAVLKMPLELQPDNIDKWKKTIIQTVYIMGKRNAEFERIVKALNDASIIPLCLKGCVIKDLYPTPELRTMGDFDILIDADKMNDAKNHFQDMGYNIRRDSLLFEVDKDEVHGEVFYSLEEEFKKDTLFWDNDMKKHSYLHNGRYLLIPSYEMAYSVIHTAKHILREGCGIRNLFDIVVLFQNRDDIDLGVVEKICKSQGYEKILYYMVTAVEHWYGMEIKSDIPRMDIESTEKFMEYMLSYGVFGKSTDGNVLSTQVVKTEGGNVNVYRRIFFPPKEMIWHKYRYLKKCSFLLPFAWIHRFITAVFVRRYSLNGMISGISESISYGKDRDKWLDELGLK